MPPKKADSTKHSNVSMAQFVYDGDESEVSGLAPPVPASASASASATVAAAPSNPSQPIEMDTDGQGDGGGDTDRDRERKEGFKEREHVTIEDLTLPKSIITRLAKGVLPPNTQIQANAILAMSKSATVFINHLAAAANEKTMTSNKKTIMPADVFAALEDVEFPHMRERLEAEFKKFNETQTTKRNTYRRRVAAQKKAERTGGSASGAGNDPNASMMSMASTDAGGAESSMAAPRSSKKQKPNAHDDSTMDVDGDETQEPQDASDAETEAEPEREDEDEDEDENAEEEQEDDDEDNEDEMHDALEEREARVDDDDALDNGGESD
ncbi:Uu.00g013820.m01.CDS01 [Anthostomella pinea]|uniref:DNA polymerase epsilon subunit D n=1 Tax=Anthostomella pinea TaxID=933095 RepID=A0AAI8YQ94_9PEZI|nr:Uu.00g013820.m01.CDS01 [Anthostomella pinea]